MREVLDEGKNLAGHTNEGENTTFEQTAVEDFFGSLARFGECFGEFVGIDVVVGFDSLDEHLSALVVVIDSFPVNNSHNGNGENYTYENRYEDTFLVFNCY